MCKIIECTNTNGKGLQLPPMTVDSWAGYIMLTQGTRTLRMSLDHAKELITALQEVTNAGTYEG